MPIIDDQLRDRMREAASRPAGVDDLFVRLGSRKRRRATTRKLGKVGLAVAVLVGTVGGFALLGHAFRTGPNPATAPAVENGALVISIPASDDSHLWLLSPTEQDLDPTNGATTAGPSAMRQLTTDHGTVDTEASVSPDGSTVAFVRQDSKDALGSLWLIGMDGSDEHLVTRAPADVEGPVWSPDGSLIAFSAADEPEGRALYTIHPDGSDLRRIARGQDVGALALSPDGGWIVFSGANVHIPGGSYDLWKVSPDGTGLTDLTSTAATDETDPAWSPDGSTIAFVTPDGIQQMPADGGPLHVVVPSPPLDEGPAPTRPAWSPDGSYLTYVSEAPSPLGSTVYVLPEGSANAFPLATGSDFAWQPIPAGSSPTPSRPADLGFGFPTCRVMSMPILVAGSPGAAFVVSKVADNCPKPGDGQRFVAADLDGDGVVDTEPVELSECFPPVGCETFAAPDVNDDGTSEVAVSEAGADGYGVRLFAVTASPPAIEPIDVVDPLGIGYIQTGSLQFAWVDVAGHSEGARCDTPPNGATFTIFGVDKLDPRADVRYTVLRIDGARATVVGASGEKIALSDAPVPGNQLCDGPLYGSASNFPDAQGPEGHDIGLEFNVCDVKSLSGVDLLGDGTDGTAWTGTKVGTDGRCPDPTGTDHLVAIDYTGDGRADAFDQYALPSCFECRPFGTTDLKGDGHEQLVLVAQGGSEIEYTMMVADIREGGVWFGSVFVTNDTGKAPLGLHDGDPFTFWAGGDEGRDEYVECLGSPPLIQLTESSTPVDGTTRSLDVATFGMRGSFMVLVDSAHSEQPASEPVPAANTGPTCGGLDFDPWA